MLTPNKKVLVIGYAESSIPALSDDLPTISGVNPLYLVNKNGFCAVAYTLILDT